MGCKIALVGQIFKEHTTEMITGTCTRLVCFSCTHRHPPHTHTQCILSHYKMNFMITKFQKTVLEQMVAVSGLSSGMICVGHRASASPPVEIHLLEGVHILGTTKRPSAEEAIPGGKRASTHGLATVLRKRDCWTKTKLHLQIKPMENAFQTQHSYVFTESVFLQASHKL